MNDQQRLQSVRGSISCDGYPSLLATVLFSIVLCLCPLTLHTSEQTTNILILKSGNAPVYDNVVDHIKNHFVDLCANRQLFCNKLYIQSYISNEAKPTYQKYDLVITLGVKAQQYAKRNLKHSNMINAMIPSGSGDFSQAASPGKTQIIMLDQPIERSLLLIKKVVPAARHVGILISPLDEEPMSGLSQIAEKIGLDIYPEVIVNEDAIGRKLSLLLDKIDVLLAQPDIKIHNRKTVSKILLSSYRRKTPVIGFSSAYVKAGALAAVFSSPEDIGQHIGDSIASYLTHGKIVAGTNFPRFFSVSINSQVAHSLGIQLDSEPDDIARFIRDNEK